MKFSEILDPGTLRIDAYDAEHFCISGQVFAHAVLLLPDAPVRPWVLPQSPSSSPPSRSMKQNTLEKADLEDFEPADIRDLERADLEALLDARPQVILIGTGATPILPPPSLLAAGAEDGIGIEWMRTGAACRTYNLLASEGRRVAAGLLLERP